MRGLAGAAGNGRLRLLVRVTGRCATGVRGGVVRPSTRGMLSIVGRPQAAHLLRRGADALAGELRARYARWVAAVVAAARQVCADRLLGAVVYGSVGRDRPHEGSDIDLMLVVDGLPPGRAPRAALGEALEDAVLRVAADVPALSLVLRTPAEVESGFPLLLDMIAEGRIVWDPQGVVGGLFARWRARLEQHGARRIATGEAWHWDLAGAAPPGRWSL